MENDGTWELVERNGRKRGEIIGHYKTHCLSDKALSEYLTKSEPI